MNMKIDLTYSISSAAFVLVSELIWEVGLSNNDWSGSDGQEQSKMSGTTDSGSTGCKEPASKSKKCNEEADSATDEDGALYPVMGLSNGVTENR